MTTMTSPEVARAIAAGADTALVSLGSVEQHGPALPLNVDVLHGRATCLRAADLCEGVLVGPDIPFGIADLHMGFPGTITVRQETLEGLLHDVAASLEATGLRLIYFWLAHAQSLPALQSALSDINATLSLARACGPSDFAAYAAATWTVMGAEEGTTPAVAGSHAGEIEASMVRAIAPTLFRADAAAAGTAWTGDVDARAEAEGMAAVSQNGVLGDQRAADPARGARYLDRLARWLAQDLDRQRAALGLRVMP